MDNQAFLEMIMLGLAEVVACPMTENERKLAMFKQVGQAYYKDTFYWLDYERANRN